MCAHMEVAPREHEAVRTCVGSLVCLQVRAFGVDFVAVGEATTMCPLLAVVL